MFESKKTPGKKFGSAFAGRSYDERHQGGEAEGPQHGMAVDRAKAAVEPKEGESEGAEQVVAQHGPATSVHSTHDHKAKKHHVTSVHEDGHVHDSDHETAEEAHEEGGKLASVSPKKSGEAGDQQGAMSEEDGFQMPDLA